MARLATVVTAVATALAVTTDWTAAQELATLHVYDFALRADRTAVHVGEPFHITISARLAERIAALDNVTLPNLSGFEELGDERRCSETASGTTCDETLTLDATQPGDRTLGPATLAAIDGRTARPSRFITDTLVLRVTPAGAARTNDVRETIYALAADGLRLALVALFLAIAGAVLWRLRPRARHAVVRDSAPPSAVARAPQREPPEFEQLVAALAREPTRERVTALRHALRARAQARDDETLADLLARDALPEAAGTAALTAVERAAFCEDTQLPQAVREALPYLR